MVRLGAEDRAGASCQWQVTRWLGGPGIGGPNPSYGERIKKGPLGPFVVQGDQAGSSALWAEAVCSLATGSRRLMYFQSASSM
ncbi:hypothetical protein PsSCT_45290 [Pseudomonas sp. SCT]